MDALAFASLSSLLRSLDVRRGGGEKGHVHAAAAAPPGVLGAADHARAARCPSSSSTRAAAPPVALHVAESAAGWLITAPLPGVAAAEAEVLLTSSTCAAHEWHGGAASAASTLHLRAGRLNTQLRCVAARHTRRGAHRAARTARRRAHWRVAGRTNANVRRVAHQRFGTTSVKAHMNRA
jgi:hypothetical protein